MLRSRLSPIVKKAHSTTLFVKKTVFDWWESYLYENHPIKIRGLPWGMMEYGNSYWTQSNISWSMCNCLIGTHWADHIISEENENYWSIAREAQMKEECVERYENSHSERGEILRIFVAEIEEVDQRIVEDTMENRSPSTSTSELRMFCMTSSITIQYFMIWTRESSGQKLWEEGR